MSTPVENAPARRQASRVERVLFVVTLLALVLTGAAVVTAGGISPLAVLAGAVALLVGVGWVAVRLARAFS